MKPIYINQSALGPSNWLPIDYIELAFGIGLGLSFNSTANLTASVQHSFDDPNLSGERGHLVLLVQTASTTVTVTDTGPEGKGHNLITNDSVIIAGSNIPGADGEWTVTVTGVNTYTYVSLVNQTASSTSAVACGMRPFNHATLSGITSGVGRTDGNYAWPIRAVRLNNTVWVAGTATLAVIQGHGR